MPLFIDRLPLHFREVSREGRRWLAWSALLPAIVTERDTTDPLPVASARWWKFDSACARMRPPGGSISSVQVLDPDGAGSPTLGTHDHPHGQRCRRVAVHTKSGGLVGQQHPGPPRNALSAQPPAGAAVLRPRAAPDDAPLSTSRYARLPPRSSQGEDRFRGRHAVGVDARPVVSLGVAIPAASARALHHDPAGPTLCRMVNDNGRGGALRLPGRTYSVLRFMRAVVHRLPAAPKESRPSGAAPRPVRTHDCESSRRRSD